MDQLIDFLSRLWETQGFPPRWHCGVGWLPFTGWFMITADLLIFGAYTSIPLLLLYFVNQKKDMVFPRIFWLFAAFIFACGISHLLDAIMFWWPAYRLNALERFITGLISWGTVFALVPIVPMALALRSPAALEKEIEERKKAENSLRQLNLNLERMVAQRTQDLHEKAWQLESANRELESFSYSVSHDLKSPLRKIEQFTEIVMQRAPEQLGPDLRHYLERIGVNATQMAQLIEDILSFSRVANAELKRESINLSEMTRQIIADYQEQEPARNVEVLIEDDVLSSGDPVLIHTILQNLLGNAWKYTSKKQQARIEFGRADAMTGEPYSYFVRDNGVGFDMASSDRLFQPFQRLHLKSDFPGSGIGLANVQRIVSRHGGRVWAEGVTGEGATFYFTLGGSAGVKNELKAGTNPHPFNDLTDF